MGCDSRKVGFQVEPFVFFFFFFLAILSLVPSKESTHFPGMDNRVRIRSGEFELPATSGDTGRSWVCAFREGQVWLEVWGPSECVGETTIRAEGMDGEEKEPELKWRLVWCPEGQACRWRAPASEAAE